MTMKKANGIFILTEPKVGYGDESLIAAVIEDGHRNIMIKKVL
ncbi:hypothetical protein PUW24_21335 [Paenibacillus urinalis]|uniref:Uncharacterized protein n=1 Tax=Paenibacillus urinalis TaxID=521520 RepID=A0AAX3MTI1_9BACL|nr:MULTISPECIES: hypothetical protein [Paenibacillus]WDH80622.1 hypothetical protein PUW23_13745 [Paenibacillus urinalis]WDH96674.1 hypothetical protein PUW24_21335 [Paenibacillus urinalis]WDI00318.1 hypothetical protein PUW25_13490 [Paenibacillus urinalis]